MNKEQMWDYLKNSIATEDEMRLVTNINGYSEETMLSILYARTGYRAFEQMEDEDEFETTGGCDDLLSDLR